MFPKEKKEKKKAMTKRLRLEDTKRKRNKVRPAGGALRHLCRKLLV